MAIQTSTNNYQNSRFIVGTGSTAYATIQAAINAANTAGAPASVYIRPGTYTENLTLYDGIALEGTDNALVTIIGTHTPPNSGDITFSRIGFQSATHVFSSAAAGTTILRPVRCRFIITDGYIFNLANWTGDLRLRFCTQYVSSTTCGIINNAGAAPVIISYCSLGKGTGKSLTMNGLLTMECSSIFCPIVITGAAVNKIYGGCYFGGMISVGGTADLYIANSTISTGTAVALTVTTSTPITLENVVINTTNALAIDGTGTVNFAEATFVNSKALKATITEGLAGVVKTGEIYANTVLRQDQSGFYSWAAAGPYYDSATLGTFKLLVGGTGYIRGKVVTWVAQDATGMTSGACWFIYIDSTGTIGKTSSRTDQLFIDNIVLFQCLYDETSGTKIQYVVKENHPYNFPTGTSNFLHNTAGAVIENVNNGANIVAGTSGTKVSITVQDSLDDHGLNSIIYAAADVTWNKMYKNAAGKWARDGAAANTFAGRWNNAGTPTTLSGAANLKFCIYRLYVAKNDLQTPDTTTPIPQYFAVLDTVAYDKQTDCTTAISNGLPAVADGELALLELAQLGFIIFRQSTGAITLFSISKSTLRSSVSAGSGSTIAGLITTSTTNFDGFLSVADTNVQAALETLDEWGKMTDGYLLIGSTGTSPVKAGLTAGTGISVTNGAGSIAIAATGTILAWSEITGATKTIVVQEAYVADRGTQIIFTLPATAALGTEFKIQGKGAGLWKIAQGAGQQIYVGSSATASGAGGYLEATDAHDAISLVCITADTIWATQAVVGNITVA
jgi:hypothetical protein